jgi:hypothetical protein
MRLITTDSPLYHRRLVREVKACLGVNGPGAYTEVDGIEKRVWAIRLSNGRVVVQVDDHGTRECRDATHAAFHDGNGHAIAASRIAP